MIESFLIQPFLAILFIAISCSLLGVFTLWKKISYFGDAFSHSIILGIFFAIFFNISQIWMMLFFALVFCGLVVLIMRNDYFSSDVIVMMLSYFSVALAIMFNNLWLKNFNINAYILGDILAVESFDVLLLGILAAMVVAYSFFALKKILLINVNEDFAKIAGIKTEIWNFSFLVILALVIAFSIKVTGILLMTALLIMPAAIARIYSTSPKQMVLLSLSTSLFGAILSFKVASNYDLTISSTIVVIFSGFFFLSLLVKNYISNK